MEIRAYRREDIKEIAELFYNTVHTVNVADYTEEQLDAWADGNINLSAWDRSFREHRTLVAVMTSDPGNGAEQIVGFADMDGTGYLDRLYVHKDFQRRRIASALCDRLEQTADVAEFTTHASLTAKPFFEKRGYQVVQEQQVEGCGLYLEKVVSNGCGNHISKSRSVCPGTDQSGGYDREDKRFSEDLRIHIFR